jgi:hypothetical protein
MSPVGDTLSIRQARKTVRKSPRTPSATKRGDEAARELRAAGYRIKEPTTRRLPAPVDDLPALSPEILKER